MIDEYTFGIALTSVMTYLVSIVLTHRICDPKSRLHVLDHPNERSLHSYPIPRTGGVAIVTGVVSGAGLHALLTEPGPILPWLALSAVLISVLSYIDDHRGLSVRVRLVGHLASAGILVASGLAMPFVSLPGIFMEWPAWLGIILSVLFLVWMVNLYNFMDGMDGFAGGMAVIGFGTLAVLGFLAGNSEFAAVCMIVASASAGFLMLNFPPARIFMGDTGSAFLGLMAGGLCLWGSQAEVFPIWVGMLVFSPFIVDASVVLLQRLWRGERVWEAHKSHYYQRLVQLGWGHKKTVLMEYALMLSCSASALWALHLDKHGQWWLIAFWVTAYILLMAAVSYLERMVRK